MQTNFSLAQLADPNVAECEQILRKCVHCGFCTATCPTYVTLGDELDSPRGRIYLIKNFLESDAPPSDTLVKHVDRCLSCLSCMTTCPSGVNYMHLVDHARTAIEDQYRRPLAEVWLRKLLAWVLPRPRLFRLSLFGAKLARPFAALAPGRLRGLLAMAPKVLPAADFLDRRQVFPAEGERRKRVALLVGCAQQALAPEINRATIRFLTRHGCEVVVAEGGCCGALTHHMGKEDDAKQAARRNIAAWMTEHDGDGIDAVVINASGCGTTVKDYGFLFRNDADWADSAAKISELAADISELAAEFDLASTLEEGPSLAYHSACSLQHGQQISALPADLLRRVGFEVAAVPEGHLCCGSAGTYNLMQPDLADKLLQQKLANIDSLGVDAVAAGNIGCLIQIGRGATPVVHTVELLDWATGGPKPSALTGK